MNASLHARGNPQTKNFQRLLDGVAVDVGEAKTMPGFDTTTGHPDRVATRMVVAPAGLLVSRLWL